MMRLTNEAVIRGADLLRRALTAEMPAALKLAAIRLARRVGEEARTVDHLRQELVLAAAERDARGDPVVVQHETGATMYRIRPEAQGELDRQWRTVLADTVDLAGAAPLVVEDLVETSIPAEVVLGLLELGLAADPPARDQG